jgi:hypothetical protein
MPLSFFAWFVYSNCINESHRTANMLNWVTIGVSVLSSSWEGFWTASTIKGTTINFIDTPFIGPIPFLIPLYLLLVLVAVAIFIVMTRDRPHIQQIEGSLKKNSRKGHVDARTRPQEPNYRLPLKRQTVIKALLSASVAVATLFALRMDYGWYKLWQLDREVLSSRSLNERITLFHGPTYYFAEDLKRVVPPFEKVKIFTNDSYQEMVLRYYLLPIKVSENGNYIVVFRDNMVFDPSRNMLLKDGNVVEKNVIFI